MIEIKNGLILNHTTDTDHFLNIYMISSIIPFLLSCWAEFDMHNWWNVKKSSVFKNQISIYRFRIGLRPHCTSEIFGAVVSVMSENVAKSVLPCCLQTTNEWKACQKGTQQTHKQMIKMMMKITDTGPHLFSVVTKQRMSFVNPIFVLWYFFGIQLWFAELLDVSSFLFFFFLSFFSLVKHHNAVMMNDSE